MIPGDVADGAMLGASGIETCIKYTLSCIHEVCSVAFPHERDVSVGVLPGSTDWAVMPGHYPDRRSLEYGQMLAFLRNLRDDLSSRSACPDNADPFPSQVIIPIPPGGVHHSPLERVKTLYIGIFWHVELTNCGNKKIGGNCIRLSYLGFFATDPLDGGSPFLGLFIPPSFVHRGAESDVPI